MCRQELFDDGIHLTGAAKYMTVMILCHVVMSCYLTLLTSLAVFIMCRQELFDDGIHLTGAGYNLMGDLVYQGLQRAMDATV
jgi:hypothetical protein